jgi:ketosteroid isomerase-like protein
MNRSIVTGLGLLCVLTGACSSETVAQPPPPPIDWRSFQVHATADAGAPTATDKERAAADAYARALVSPGAAQLAPVLDENVHVEIVGLAEVHGREHAVQAHEATLGAFDQRTFTPTRIWLTDSSQALEWTMTGTFAREWMGIAPTGKPAMLSGIALLWTKDDGLITDVHLYFDVAVAKAALGVGPKELLAIPRPPAPPAGQPPLVFEQTGSPDEKANVATARAALDALESSETAYATSFTDDVEVVTAEHPQPVRGKDEARAYFRAMHRAIDQLDTIVENAWGVRQYAVIEYYIRGAQIGPLHGMAPQRTTTVNLELVDVMEIRDGKIARVWRYENPAQLVATR